MITDICNSKVIRALPFLSSPHYYSFKLEGKKECFESLINSLPCHGWLRMPSAIVSVSKLRRKTASAKKWITWHRAYIKQYSYHDIVDSNFSIESPRSTFVLFVEERVACPSFFLTESLTRPGMCSWYPWRCVVFSGLKSDIATGWWFPRGFPHKKINIPGGLRPKGWCCKFVYMLFDAIISISRFKISSYSVVQCAYDRWHSIWFVDIFESRQNSVPLIGLWNPRDKQGWHCFLNPFVHRRKN